MDEEDDDNSNDENFDDNYDPSSPIYCNVIIHRSELELALTVMKTDETLKQNSLEH